MKLTSFINASSARLTDLRTQGVTGRYSVALKLEAGKPTHGEHEFIEEFVLRREPIDASLVTMLQMCYTEAQRMDSRFFGGFELQFEIFQGNIVDTRTSIRQSALVTL
jgi:hypothetical protein